MKIKRKPPADHAERADALEQEITRLYAEVRELEKQIKQHRTNCSIMLDAFKTNLHRNTKDFFADLIRQMNRAVAEQVLSCLVGAPTWEVKSVVEQDNETGVAPAVLAKLYAEGFRPYDFYWSATKKGEAANRKERIFHRPVLPTNLRSADALLERLIATAPATEPLLDNTSNKPKKLKRK
jgi:regulator of replication initiation timing